MSPLQPTLDRYQQCTQVRQVFELLGPGCVAFYPRLADLTGSVTAALLLGQCLYWTRSVLRQQPQRDGWFWKTAAEWRRETGLSRREQDTARCRLRALGLLQEQRRGMPARRWYRVDVAGLQQHLDRLPGVVCSGWPWDTSDLARSLGQPVLYWRRLHELTGSVTAALYLSRALFWQRLALQRPQPHGDWLHRPVFHSQQLLRLGRRQQEHARARLRARGLIRERRAAGAALAAVDPTRARGTGPTSGGPRRRTRWRDPSAVGLPAGRWPRSRRRAAALRQARVHESAKQDCTDAPNRDAQMRQPWLAQSCSPHIQGITAEKPHPQTLRAEVVAEAAGRGTLRPPVVGAGVAVPELRPARGAVAAGADRGPVPGARAGDPGRRPAVRRRTRPAGWPLATRWATRAP